MEEEIGRCGCIPDHLTHRHWPLAAGLCHTWVGNQPMTGRSIPDVPSTVMGVAGSAKKASGEPPFVCAKPVSPFPSLLRLPSKATGFPPSITGRWRALARPRSSKGVQDSAHLHLPQAPPCPQACAACLLPPCKIPAVLGCLHHFCLPLRSLALGVFLPLFSCTTIHCASTSSVKAARERMRRTTSHHQHFLAFSGEGKG